MKRSNALAAGKMYLYPVQYHTPVSFSPLTVKNGKSWIVIPLFRYTASSYAICMLILEKEATLVCVKQRK